MDAKHDGGMVVDVRGTLRTDPSVVRRLVAKFMPAVRRLAQRIKANRKERE
jgi:hypothetical protein